MLLSLLYIYASVKYGLTGIMIRNTSNIENVFISVFHKGKRLVNPGNNGATLPTDFSLQWIRRQKSRLSAFLENVGEFKRQSFISKLQTFSSSDKHKSSTYIYMEGQSSLPASLKSLYAMHVIISWLKPLS